MKDIQDTGFIEAGEDAVGARFGMWLFLATEVFLFVPPFLLYSAYRYEYAPDFHNASQTLDLTLGALNTFILLTSSLALTLGVAFVKSGRRTPALSLIASTVILGAAFLFIKGLEWSDKISHGIYPSSAALLGQTRGEAIYYGLYFFMTGVHALHVLIGVGLLSAMWFMVYSGRAGTADNTALENSGLYWHIVDVVWTFLFPVFYLLS